MPSTPAAEDDARVDGRDARWAAHRSSRRAELVKAARRAVHHHGPDLSMDELAAEIGTSKSIIYRYFTDKSGLQGEVGAAVIEGLRHALGEVSEQVTRPRDRIAAMVDVYLGIVESSAGVYAFVTQPEATATAGALRGFVAEIEDIVAEALLPVLRHGGAARETDHALAALWAAGVVGHVRSVAERWIAARGPGSHATDSAPSHADHSHPPADSAAADTSRALPATDLPPPPADSAAVDTGGALPATDLPLPPADGAAVDAGGASPTVEQEIAALDRAALAAHITDWLWTGAAGVARRSRATAARPDDAIGDPA